MTWPAVLFWLLILVCVCLRGPYLLYLFFAAGSFGSLQMVPGEAVGGANLLPQSVVALFLIGATLLQKGQLQRAIDAALDPAQLLLLFMFLAYGFLSAYTMPRLFYHAIEVIPVSVQLPWPVLLEPTAANITQPAYMTLSIGMALAFTLLAGRPDFRTNYLLASLFGGAVVIASGLLDMVMSAAGLADLLEPFRNATYGLILDAGVGNVRRVIGLMPEASSYGALCIGTASSLAFLRSCFQDPPLRGIAAAIIIGLVAMGALSTSSTAYVGIAVFAMVFGLNWLRRCLDSRAPARDELRSEAFSVLALGLALLVVVTVWPRLLDPAYDMIDTMLFQKTESFSYIERSMWTRVGMEAFYSTHGIGVGLGSARTSNWFVAILSNTGIVGAGLLAGFIVRLYLLPRPAEPFAAEYLTALKFSLLPGFIMAGLAGTTPDIGVGVGATFGMMLGLAAPKPPARPPGPPFDRRSARPDARPL